MSLSIAPEITGEPVVEKKPVSVPRRLKLKKPPVKKLRPTKVLPTERITFVRQLDLLRAWAAASGPGNKSVSNGDVAPIVKMTESTISLANPFFASIGLLQRGEGGYTPAAEVMAFNRAYEWNKETASHKLRPIIQESWFAKALLPRLSFGPLEIEAAIGVLADETNAQPEYRGQLKLMLDYMEAAGIAVREGNQMRAASGTVSAPERSENEPAPSRGPDPSRGAISTTFSQPTMGIVNFHVDVKVDMAEFSGWSADRISAFFSGIAQVLAAKAQIEKRAAE